MKYLHDPLPIKYIDYEIKDLSTQEIYFRPK